MMVYRAALIGCGKIGSEFADDPRIKGIYTHAGAYTQCPDTKLIAVCDNDRNKSEKCKSRWQVPDSYTDYKRMIADKEPDILSICTPDQTHYEIIRTILAFPNVKAVFAEKPLALDVRDATELVEFAKKKGIVLAVNYSRRYAERIQCAKQLIDSGSIGEIQSVNGYYSNGTMHSGTHWFDLARFLIGEVSKVHGINRLNEKNSDPTYDAYLVFQNGATGFLHGGIESNFSIFEMDILGSQGRISIKHSGNTIEVYQVHDDPDYTGYRALQLSNICHDVLKDTIYHAVADIVECLQNSKTPLCSGSDGLAALKIAHAVRSSVESGNCISV